MAKPFLYIDFEFYGSNERILNLVCCSVWDGTDPVQNWWLWQEGTARLREWLLAKKDTHVICCYGAIAEARSFISLGLDPSQFKWIDLYAEWRQLQNCVNKYEFGHYFKDGKLRKSVPIKFDDRGKAIEDDRDHHMIGVGLVDAVAALLRIDLDSAHKDAMRDRILAKGPYSAEEQAAIMAYCASDIELLPRLWEEMRKGLLETFYAGDTKKLAAAVFARGAWCADMAIVEAEGIPLYLPRLHSVSQNHTLITGELIQHLCENYYPFYTKEKDKWVQKYKSFKTWVESKDLQDKWPLTDGGKKAIKNFSTDEKVLEAHSHYPEIKEFLRTRKGVNQLRTLRPEALDEFLSSVGSDHKLRTWFGPYGTQTGRNASKAKYFIPAWSAWLRCIIKPPPGWALTTVDFSAQEFLVGAMLSEDENMMEAYASGDPYLAFAKLAGAAPADATKETHAVIRAATKSTCLAEGTLVRVRNRGWVPIEQVDKDSEVWDGCSWRKHGGVVCTGVKDCVSVFGVQVTPDHPIWSEEHGWHYAGDYDSEDNWTGAQTRQYGPVPKRCEVRGLHRPRASWSDVWAMACRIGRSAIRKGLPASVVQRRYRREMGSL